MLPAEELAAGVVRLPATGVNMTHRSGRIIGARGGRLCDEVRDGRLFVRSEDQGRARERLERYALQLAGGGAHFAVSELVTNDTRALHSAQYIRLPRQRGSSRSPGWSVRESAGKLSGVAARGCSGLRTGRQKEKTRFRGCVVHPLGRPGPRLQLTFY